MNADEVELDFCPLKVIGHLQTVFKFKNGTPRQPGVYVGACGRLTILKDVFNNPEHSLDGINDFSHIWILFIFHKNGREVVKAKVKPPRLGTRLGVFATRSPHRPSPIGLSLAKIIKIEGSSLYLSGLDIIDGTPVLDIKPYIPSYDQPSELSSNQVSDEVHIAPWIAQADSSCLTVYFTQRALSQLQHFDANAENADQRLEFLSSWSEARSAIEAVLTADPRSVYRKTECTDRLYYFTLDNLHITCWFDGNTAEVLKIQHVKYLDLSTTAS